MITLGTGIGGGLMVHGTLHRGANGMAGEFGHMQVVPGRTRVPVRAEGLLGAVLLRSRAGPGCRGGGLRPVRAGSHDGGLRR